MPAIDWDDLQRRFLALLLAQEKIIEADVAELTDQIDKQLAAEGYVLTPAMETKLGNYITQCGSYLDESVRAAAALVVNTVKPDAKKSLRDKLVSQIAEQVLARRHADGLNVSDRLWWIDEKLKKGLAETLAGCRKADKTASTILYDMQRRIERSSGGLYAQVTDSLPQWLDDLHDAGRAAIKTPELRDQWRKTLRELQGYSEQLSPNGSRAATRNLVIQMRKAVQLGKEELLTKAVHWWTYDRQLYYIKRVVRTETANAHHEARIITTESDPEIIGYRWRLSGTHPKPDICDWYASCEFGLGRGVWPKDRVPRSVAHPHCMCVLAPRVRKVKKQGVGGSFAEYLGELPAGDRRALLPGWANDLHDKGVPLSALVTDKGPKRKKDVVG